MRLAALTIFTLGPMFFLLMPQYVVALVEDVGLSDSEAGNLASIELAGAALASIAALYWVKRVDLRWAIGIGAAFLILGNLLSMAVTESYAMLSAVRFVSGFLAVSLTVIAFALLGGLPNPDRGYALGVSAQLALSGSLLILLPVPVGIWGVNAIFAILVCSAVALSLVGTLFLPARMPTSNGRPAGVPTGSWHRPMLALVGAGCFLVAQVAVWAYIARIGIARGLTEQFVGAAVGLSTIAATGAALGAAWIAGRTSRFRVMAICIPLQVLLMAMLLVSSSTVAYILFVFGFNMIWSLWVPFQMGLIAEVDTSGRFIVLTPFFQSLGIAIAPALVALFLTGRNYDPAMWIGIGFVLTSLILSLPLLRQENRERA